MTPMHIFLLLEIHCSPSRESCPHLEHFLTKKVLVTPIDDLQKWGLIAADPNPVPPKGLEYQPHGWVTTEKGAAYIKALESLPLPVQRWEVRMEPSEEIKRFWRGDGWKDGGDSLFERVFGKGLF